MTTPYGISRNIGSLNYNGYIYAPVIGPLSTNKYPCSMPYHSFGTLTGQRPTPPQFIDPIYSNMNTNSRQQYIRATQQQTNTNSNQTQKSIASSMHINIKKSIAVGKSAYKVGLPLSDPISTKNYVPSGTRSALRRARSGGCTAPKKKGSIYNVTSTQGVGWGALPRQTY